MQLTCFKKLCKILSLCHVCLKQIDSQAEQNVKLGLGKS